MVNKICLNCKTSFKGRNNRKFCSQKCFGLFNGFKKGDSPWNKGKKTTYKHGSGWKLSKKALKNHHFPTKEECSYWKGKIFTEEHRSHISESLIGKEVSKETRQRMSVAKTGCASWFKGKKRKPFSKEHKRKLSEYQKENLRSKDYYQKIGLLGVKKQQDAKEPTSIEKKLYEELKNRGILFEKQRLINGKFLVDAYIPSLNLVIEADGDYWHSLNRVKKHDKAKNAYLTKCGYSLLRITGTEIRDDTFKLKLDEEIN